MTSISTKSNTSKTSPVGIRPEEEQIPEVALTLEGVEYYPREDKWPLHDGGCQFTFYFTRFRELCSDTLVAGLKTALVHELANGALGSVRAFILNTRRALEFISVRNYGDRIHSLSSRDILAYRTTLDEKHEHFLLQIRRPIKTWAGLGYPGIDEDVPGVLDQLYLKKNTTGTAIRSRDSHKGPFNDQEYVDIIKYVLDAYAEGLLRLDEMALVFLCMVFGPRPISFSSMRLGDFVVRRSEFGVDEYFLRIPAAKLKSGGRRTEFHERKLTPEYGLMLAVLKEDVRRRFADLVEAGFDADKLPVFASDRADLSYIIPSKQLTRMLQAAFTKGRYPLTVKRPGHAGETLNIHTYRFRYTLGTRMAEAGYREVEIAKALGHKRMGSAKIYTKHTEKARGRIEDAVSPFMGPLSKYYLGEAISKNDETARGFGEGRRIRVFMGKLQGDGVGNCGKSGFCGGAVPLPCYAGCRSFHPWKEADHAEVLRALLTERKRFEELGVDKDVVEANDEPIANLMILINSLTENSSAAPKELENA